MSDSFVPLVPGPVSRGETASLQLKVLSQEQAEAKPRFEPLQAAGQAEQVGQACGRPSVTLQRQGEVVTGIRIECVCGQVIELACAY